MTTQYSIKFFDEKRNHYSTYTFHVDEYENFFDALEEALYIAEELTPAFPHEWRRELATDSTTTFTYHDLENVEIVYWWGSTTIEAYVKY